MRGHAAALGSADIIVRALLEEFPELDAQRVRSAIERGIARAASASLDTEGHRVVDLHLAKAEASEESSERAAILRELSGTLEERGDADRALVVRLSAFSEAPMASDLDPLLRLASVTDRYDELPLDTMNALIDLQVDGAADRLRAIATAWEKVGRPYYAADSFERLLLVEPDNEAAFDALETFYRSTNEWPVLVDVLHRRAVQVADDKDRAELFREIGEIYEKQLADVGGALDAYREADQLAPAHASTLDALARLSGASEGREEETLDTLERLAKITPTGKERAEVLRRAAELARLSDWDRALRLFSESRSEDPDLVTAVDGYSQLLRDQGREKDVIALLLEAAARPALKAHQSRWLTDAADTAVGLGDTARAEQLYRDARISDPNNQQAGIALVELGRDAGSLIELGPILDELCRTTEDPARLRHYLLQRSKVASELGDRTGARSALARAIDLDPHDLSTREKLAEMLFEVGQWTKARPLFEGLLEDEDLLPPPRRAELHYQIAKCAFEVGDCAGAEKHLDVSIAILPDHRPSLQMKADLGAEDPHAQAASQLALANLAPPEEKATRFAALGDRYTELGDRATAREMFREALQHRPGDHLLLTKFLGLVTEDGDWSYSLDVIQKLVDTEQDKKVRARYRHLGAMIARDEIDDHEQAVALYQDVLFDDPFAFAAADELEQLLASSPDADALIRFYYQRLKDVQQEEGRTGERLRLWDELGELCLQLGRNDDAATAFEVALTLAPDDQDRKQRLADLYFGDTKYDSKAIAMHQSVLRGDKKRMESYKALRSLYERAKQPERARAIDAAVEVIGTLAQRIDGLFAMSDAKTDVAPPDAKKPRLTLANDDFVALARIDVDLALTALFAVVSPSFGVERARMRPPASVPSKEQDPPVSVAMVLGSVVGALGVKRPPVYIDKDQAAAALLAMRARDGVLTPVLTLGRAALDKSLSEPELAFALARQLTDLRNERIARLLCPRAGELAQIIELAQAPPADAGSHATRWLQTALHPVELAQAQAIGARLRERGIHPMTAAVQWLAATERAADRIGFLVIGDLATCARQLDDERRLELAWASTTDELLGVRARIEGWPVVGPFSRRTSN